MRCLICAKDICVTGPACAARLAAEGPPALWPDARTFGVRTLGIVTSAAVVLAVLVEAAHLVVLVIGARVARATVDSSWDLSPIYQSQQARTWLQLALIATRTLLLVLLVIWSYRARRNLDAFPGAEPCTARGWAIAGWLVPPVSLIYPWRTMADLVRGSLAARWWERALGAVWWVAWLFCAVVGLGAWNVDLDRLVRLLDLPPGPDTTTGFADHFTQAAGFYRAPLVAAVIAGAALVVLLVRVSAAQEARIRYPQRQAYLLPGMAVPAAPEAPTVVGVPGGGDGAPPPGAAGSGL
ncbi:DUF4328 domain-containing protein [Polymorphospora rubra]|uniref:DUF4328 domain-containing protein n=1 Tax=Polymorphospora rubra TaxID=338584 RepID=UPI00340515EA